MNLTELTKKLTSLPGPSGFEDEVREFIADYAAPFADEISTDNMGNLLVLKRAKQTKKKRQNRVDNETAPSRLFAAHMDEVGLIVTHSKDGGYYGFDCLGGIDKRVLPGKRVLIGGSKVPAVIGLPSIHLADTGARDKVPEVSAMSLDAFGDTGVEAGTYAVFDSDWVEFGKGFVKAKALDDRIGCAVMLKLLELDLSEDTWFAFTVQEEAGCRGAAAAANRLNCDRAYVIETTTAADIPSKSGGDRVCELTKGAVLPFMDGRTIYSRELWNENTLLADKHNITWQTKTRIAGGTDAGTIQNSGAGCKVAAISVPARNLHSPATVINLEDLDAVYEICKHIASGK
ncbi:MAG: M42 family peptidase [Oscillospiraceae bacterium]|jgi:endoglucanase|nr:M42 family peptidase [Oscillospiraceae bacterium]